MKKTPSVLNVAKLSSYLRQTAAVASRPPWKTPVFQRWRAVGLDRRRLNLVPFPSVLERKCARLALLLAIAAGPAAGQNPFSAAATLEQRPDGAGILSVSFSVPAQHELYADSIKVAAPDGVTLIPERIPTPFRKRDAFSGAEHGVFTNSVMFGYRVLGLLSNALEITVGYQGCSPSFCYMPESTRIRLPVPAAGAGVAPALNDIPAGPLQPDPGPATNGWAGRMRGFSIAGRQTGYMGPGNFLRFLDEAESGAGAKENRIGQMLSKSAAWKWLAVILIIAFGFGLNLTPCVLPMIPLNIAILGAGTRHGSRARGFLLGAVYASAMALAYGLLGAAVVLTGAKFGMLNSSPVFNAIVAVIFLALALAMFDVYILDFSRFQGSCPPRAGRGSGFLAAFVMGAVAALLAGSCVSPILVSVLLLAADMFGRGEVLGLVLPFLLGIGMGLPWPFLGAGLSFLPAPGKWMINLKRVFGLVIIGFAVYYGHLAYRLHRERAQESMAQVEGAQKESLDRGWMLSLPEALDEARRLDKPVLIDFWASWCKNCLAMDKTTFRDPGVVGRLEAYVKVKFRAENPADPEVREVMDYFGSIGLPTYIILKPAAPQAPL